MWTDIEEKKIPEYINKEIKISKSGTAIVWSKCDRLDIARGDTLYRRMSKKLCRVFRHYLDKNSTFKTKIRMSYKVVNGNFEEDFVPNDPLYLAVPNNLPGYENEAIMELKSKDDDPREGKIEVTFTNPETKKIEKCLAVWRLAVRAASRSRRGLRWPLLFLRADSEPRPRVPFGREQAERREMEAEVSDSQHGRRDCGATNV
jgi:hypothetical protein